MNATECCRSIGCNCGATTLVETLEKVPIWVWPLIVIGMALIIMFLINYWIPKRDDFNG